MKLNTFNFFLFIFLLSNLLSYSLFAQTDTKEIDKINQTDSLTETLTLEEAVSLALSNNQELQIQKKLIDIAQTNVFKGNAGLLPTINLIANGNYSNNISDLTIRTFQPEPAPSQISIDESGVTSTTLSAVVQADYTVFAGFSGKYQYRLLENQEQIARYQQELIANNTLLGVSELFIEIVKLQSREELIEKA